MTAIETAFVLLIALLFILGLEEFARAYWIWNTLQLAAQSGARYAMAHSNGGTLTCSSPVSGCASSTLQQCTETQTSNSLIALSSSSVTVNASCSGSAPAIVTVTAAYNFAFVAPKLFPYHVTLTGTAIAPLM